jgi:predicted DCC family thiol-disulfide oxidoreductase YuxK
MDNRNIVFYDGECGFCQSTVQVVLNNDKKGLIHFASIQSKFTEDFFNEIGEEQPDLSTFYFYTNNKLLSKSSAALYVARLLKFPFHLLFVFIVIPKIIRDFCYDIVARNRYKLTSNSCRIPTPS